MRTLRHLFENNRAWAGRMIQCQSDFFDQMAAGHAPQLLWIGCSDARVPANGIVGRAWVDLQSARRAASRLELLYSAAGRNLGHLSDGHQLSACR